MSEPLQIGDRVRVVGMETVKPANETAAQIMRGELEGKILHMQEAWSTVRFEGRNYMVPTKNLQSIATRRTFEEIGKELNTKLGVEWGKVRFFDNRMEFRSVNDTDLIIFDNGGMCFEVDAAMNSEVRLCVFQLAAISAACSEIAANCAAEHGKEEA